MIHRVYNSSLYIIMFTIQFLLSISHCFPFSIRYFKPFIVTLTPVSLSRSCFQSQSTYPVHIIILNKHDATIKPAAINSNLQNRIHAIIETPSPDRSVRVKVSNGHGIKRQLFHPVRKPNHRSERIDSRKPISARHSTATIYSEKKIEKRKNGPKVLDTKQVHRSYPISSGNRSRPVPFYAYTRCIDPVAKGCGRAARGLLGGGDARRNRIFGRKFRKRCRQGSPWSSVVRWISMVIRMIDISWLRSLPPCLARRATAPLSYSRSSSFMLEEFLLFTSS